MPIPTDTDPNSWHRYFAIHCNNVAWDLAAKDRTAAEDQTMLDAAHASSFHWAVVGTELHAMRARMLLARVHTLLGNADLALRLADEVQVYFTTKATPHWELAFVHAIYAHAAHLAGDLAAHKSAHQKARQALAAVTSEEERALIRETLDRVPAP